MKNRFFYIGLGCLVATLFWTIAAAVVSDNRSTAPNQTMHNRPNTVVVYHHSDFKDHPLDPQLRSVWIKRALQWLEPEAYGWEDNQFNWVRTADVIKSFEADWLADYGLPTGVWRKMDFSWEYACYAEPLHIEGNIIRYRVTGSRDGGGGAHQLTLTVNRHEGLAAAKALFIEKVKTLYKKMNWGLEMEPEIERKIGLEPFFYVDGGYDKTLWQSQPDPKFSAHELSNHSWMTPLNHEAVGERGHLKIRREPLTENGYRWGDPFVIRVIGHAFPYP